MTWDETANKACKENTDKQLASTATSDPKDKFKSGSTTAEYQTLIGKDVTSECTDETKLKWEGTPIELVITLMIEGFANKDKKQHPILDPKLSKVGIEFRSDKTHTNIFQILYIKSNSNIME